MKKLTSPESGSQAGTTASRNRFGQYNRTRSVPVNPNSVAQIEARNRISTNAAGWRTLTAAQRQGWNSLGAMITRTDALGQTYTLTGFLAYVSVNNNLLAAGEAIVDNAPANVTPENIQTAVVTLSAAAFSIAYTPTPLPAGQKLFVFASPQRSAGRSFEGDYRLIQVSADAGASPINIMAAYTARLGIPVAGNKIFLSIHTHQDGFLSAALSVAQIVV